MILDLFRLDSKVAVVTGAGRGIGAASALALAECGADVVIASRTQSDLDRVAERVAAAGRAERVRSARRSDQQRGRCDPSAVSRHDARVPRGSLPLQRHYRTRPESRRSSVDVGARRRVDHQHFFSDGARGGSGVLRLGRHEGGPLALHLPDQ